MNNIKIWSLITKNNLRIKNNPNHCINQYLKSIYENRNDLKCEVFYDMSVPSDRIKSKPKIFHHLIIKTINNEWHVKLHYFYNKKNKSFYSCISKIGFHHEKKLLSSSALQVSEQHTIKGEYYFSIYEGTKKELWALTVGCNSQINYYQG